MENLEYTITCDDAAYLFESFEPLRINSELSGIEIRSLCNNGWRLDSGEAREFNTHLILRLPKNTYGQIAPHPELAESFGVEALGKIIHQGSRDEVVIKLVNHGLNPFSIYSGLNIAILFVVPVVPIEQLCVVSRDMILSRERTTLYIEKVDDVGKNIIMLSFKYTFNGFDHTNNIYSSKGPWGKWTNTVLDFMRRCQYDTPGLCFSRIVLSKNLNVSEMEEAWTNGKVLRHDVTP